MRDVNSALLQAYYQVIDGLDIPVFEGEEPDDVKHKIYAVLSDAISIEQSTDNSSDVKTTLQVSVHSWEYKYNNSKNLNLAVDSILQAIKPTSTSVLDLGLAGLQMMNLSVITDRTERFGEIGGKIFISRILIFKQDIFVIS
ncbi:hypothetical protein UFOVP778_42 [uncultured Caudovirales phage]|jgi:hypothetical protein|uniref:Uncharacterized protein n=1 Tax=uncultured Caudovirales phage TaxID=2100421 RepID=A0A6J5NRB0_9CAUD|nr:hypothetical protein UFOVP778_42 [uncultured Caudovirales phage]